MSWKRCLDRYPCTLVWIFIIAAGALLIDRAEGAEIRPGVLAVAEEAGPEGTVSVLIHLRDQAPVNVLSGQLKARAATRRERHAAIVGALQATAARSQGPVIEMLAEGRSQDLVAGYTPYWISNLIVAGVRPAFLAQLEARQDIAVVELNFQHELITPVARNAWYGELGMAAPGEATLPAREVGVPPGLRAINADRCWYELGLTGDGSLICGIDTGVDGLHPALATRWRGYGGAHPPEECWLDVLADTSGVPYDADSHGTHTMGTMCGMDPATGDTVGVAWGAQWIATNAIGQGAYNEEFDNDVIASFQWIADPDGDPGTVDDVPDVCQNSWGAREYPPESSWYYRCDQLWWDAIDNCEAAGVVVTFSAGNEGPTVMSCRIPPDRATTSWNTYAVGAVDATNYEHPYPIALFSSRGPSSCDEVSIKPEVSAPGVDVVSCIPGAEYGPMSGTSMAGPHVAGVVALLRELDPDLEVDRIKQILMDSSVDHGLPGEDHDYGWGVIDAYAACLAVMNGYGRLDGAVTDAGTGDPLEGAMVALPDLGRSAVCDPTGSFDLRHIPAGTHQLVTQLFGYEPDTTEAIVTDDARETVAIQLTSYPRGTLTGLVTSEEGGVPGVYVQLTGVPVEMAVTDPQGAFVFPALPAGDYALAAGLFGWTPGFGAPEVLAGDTTYVELEVERGVDDDFEIFQGWEVGDPQDTAYDGIWERG
ncbi:MAG: S8 family serine peptidase, partial [Candidatus Eisenbacteria bacterium]|nr:S8 family serine peptidase [Candidatus Eisenbacteria bacterium]